jgi:hypothetical protein
MNIQIVLREMEPVPPEGNHYWVINAHAHLQLIKNEDGTLMSTPPLMVCIVEEDELYCDRCGGDPEVVFNDRCEGKV